MLSHFTGSLAVYFGSKHPLNGNLLLTLGEQQIIVSHKFELRDQEQKWVTLKSHIDLGPDWLFSALLMNKQRNSIHIEKQVIEGCFIGKPRDEGPHRSGSISNGCPVPYPLPM